MSETMRAVRAHSADPARLTAETVARPAPGPGEVLVAVHASAVTADELTWSDTWPLIPLHDLSGVVAGVGDGVSEWRPGDAVYGLIGFDRPGAAAEYVAVPVDQLAAKPAGVDHLGAAALPLGALTAWQALHEHGGLGRPGGPGAARHVLVHGGAGGVGVYAVQLAVHAGARVTATASARDADFVAGLGAHTVIDYTTPFESRVTDVDIVVDTVGAATMARSWSVLRSGGVIVGVAEKPSDADDRPDGARGVYFVVRPDREQLAELSRLVDAGALRPVLGPVFDLDQLATAITTQRDTHVRGKVAIRVRP
jgi:NADPH:quinone reductase-like Zn-dependent oxidoreductase